ncbi:MAG: potassium transporter TrkG [Thomasclavelia ramosa]
MWFSIFHSISAFCNAGFDLMGNFEPYSSLVSFQDNWYLNMIIMLLIIIGGLGFWFGKILLIIVDIFLKCDYILK